MYRAFCYVITPDYKYWNGVHGTDAETPAESLRLLAEVIEERWPHLPEWRKKRMVWEAKADKVADSIDARSGIIPDVIVARTLTPG